MENSKKFGLLIALLAISGAIYYLQSLKSPAKLQDENAGIIEIQPRAANNQPSDVLEDNNKEATDNSVPENISRLSIEEKAKLYPRARDIVNPSGFINTPSIDSAGSPQASSGQADKISIGELVGKKIILVDFWTYSCINCQRTLPYLTSWYEKYRNSGLEIIGVHTPEFQFEQKYENVLAATKKFGVKYPVVLDNDYATWTAYKNRYWPRKYLIDIDGFIVYDHIGEGFYDETEQKIQELLKERMAVLGIKEEMAEEMAKPKNIITVDFSKVKSPETYFGSSRNEFLVNGKRFTAGTQTLIEPANTLLNKLYLAGDWNIQPEYAENKSKEAKIIFRYNSKNVYLVAGAKTETTIKIKKDGNLIKEELIKDEALYRILENSDYGEHILEIIIENAGLRAFAFTFG